MKRQAQIIGNTESLPDDVWAEVALCISSDSLTDIISYHFLIEMSWVNQRFYRIIQEVVFPRFKKIGKCVIALNPRMLKKFVSVERLNLSSINNLYHEEYEGILDRVEDEDVEHLSRVLIFYPNEKVTNRAMKSFVCLRDLSLYLNSNISNTGLRHLSTLTELELAHPSRITDEALQYLPLLQTLKIELTDLITDRGLEYVPQLSHLSLIFNKTITDQGLRGLTNLRKLHLFRDSNITGRCLRSLPSLVELVLRRNVTILGEDIRGMPLECLHLDHNEKLISSDVVLSFHQLRKVSLTGPLASVCIPILLLRGVSYQLL